ncbi:hypothetical protein HK405_010556 [Cladochytrium tenue]|nr:hypothetical protein HK405_010556 [Cladochytrium tenue]
MADGAPTGPGSGTKSNVEFRRGGGARGGGRRRGGHGGPPVHSHDGVNFHSSHDAPDSPPPLHSHDGVNFHSSHGPAEPPPMHSHDGINFHSSHGHGHGAPEDFDPLMGFPDMASLQQALRLMGLTTGPGIEELPSDEPEQQQQQQQPAGLSKSAKKRSKAKLKKAAAAAATASAVAADDGEGHGHHHGDHGHHGHDHGHGHGHDDHGHDHGHGHGHDGGPRDHGHTHEILDGPGKYDDRDSPLYSQRNWKERAFTVGIGGPVGSGKTALMLALCRALHPKYNIAAVTNDIFTTEDAEFLIRHDALPEGRIRAVETGGCPHAAIREDVSANLGTLETLQEQFGCELLLIESGGDNLAANYSRELADYIIYVIDVSGGDKIPRKGGPGITQSDLLVVNKTDLAPLVGADLGVMERDAARMRDVGPTIFAQVKNGVAVDAIVKEILGAYRSSGAEAAVAAAAKGKRKK